jgi:hypothetical protein
VKKRWCWCLVALMPIPAFADGGGPLLLIFNGFLFTFGQAWILLAEFVYLAKRAPAVPKGKLAKWVLGANLVSTLGGAFLIPLLWGAVFGFLSYVGPWRDSDFGGFLIAFGTWVAGDNSPYPQLAMFMSGLLFIATYFATVWIEYRLLLRWDSAKELTTHNALRTVYTMNAISYAGLVILFICGMKFLW